MTKPLNRSSTPPALGIQPGAFRHSCAGFLILTMIIATVVNGLTPDSFFAVSISKQLFWLAGSCGWGAALLLIPDTTRALRIQISLILVIGFGLIVYAASQGAGIDITGALGSNSGLLTMIAAVGFLRLVALPDPAKSEALPTGHKAYLQTLLGINITSSIINISAPILIADRIHQQRPLAIFTSQSITRVFCGVASWSPFFGAMAVVITYVEGVQVLTILKIGLPFTVIGFLVVYVEARLRYRKQLAEFVGYPIHLNSIKIPVILMLNVVLMTHWLPNTPILVVIALCAIALTAITLTLRIGPVASYRMLRDHVANGLPRMVNELVLFQAAGVLAVGMAVMIQLGAVDNPFTVFDASSASLVLGLIIIAAAMGIHPVIMISSISPLLLTLNPDPNFLAATYLIGWNLGTCASPLSGTHLVFQGRYGIPSWKAAVANWPYVLVMYVISTGWLIALYRYLG